MGGQCHLQGYQSRCTHTSRSSKPHYQMQKVHANVEMDYVRILVSL